MDAVWTPLQWPASWNSPTALSLLKNTCIDTLLIDNSDEFDSVRAAAGESGLRVIHPDTPPDEVTLIKGTWPGVRPISGSGGSGPTGVAWVDSNGWAIRLTAALQPKGAVWLDAPPKGDPRYTSGSYLIAIADAAARGGRWIIALDQELADGLSKQEPDSLATWKTITGAAGFFASHRDWDRFTPRAVAGVISDFTSSNQPFSRELLNLLDRAGMQYRILPKARLATADLAELRAVIYCDDTPPAESVRRQVEAFVQSGGMLITVPQWGTPEGAKAEDYPRFDVRAAGKGRIATAEAKAGDPYQVANDSVILVSHRYDLVRFWNGGATGSYYTVSHDGSRAVVHLLFYANRGPAEASVRIAGRYRSVKAYTAGGPQVPNVEMTAQNDAVELHLPQVPQYVALEFQA